MKNDIHPKYNEKTTIKCACGAELETGSTQENLEVEICSQCHPFFTGKKKIVDTAGRVDRFKKLAKKAAEKKEAAAKASAKKKKEAKAKKETKKKKTKAKK